MQHAAAFVDIGSYTVARGKLMCGVESLFRRRLILWIDAVANLPQTNRHAPAWQH